MSLFPAEGLSVVMKWVTTCRNGVLRGAYPFGGGGRMRIIAAVPEND